MAIYKRTSLAALALATSANGTARNGSTLALDNVQFGTLSVAAHCELSTSSVVATFKAQVSMDGTNWSDLKTISNAANVATGTDTEDLALIVPDGVHGWMFFRVVATLSGAATGASDKTSVTYRWVQPGGMLLT